MCQLSTRMLEGPNCPFQILMNKPLRFPDILWFSDGTSAGASPRLILDFSWDICWVALPHSSIVSGVRKSPPYCLESGHCRVDAPLNSPYFISCYFNRVAAPIYSPSDVIISIIVYIILEGVTRNINMRGHVPDNDHHTCASTFLNIEIYHSLISFSTVDQTDQSV